MMSKQTRSVLPLADILANRTWARRLWPFPHFFATHVFVDAFYRALEAEFFDVLNRGLADFNDPARLSRNMQNSDAYSWNFPPDIEGNLGLFYSADWYCLLAGITKVDCTVDVNGALHHHQLHSRNGSIHRDLGVGWFSNQPRPDGINPMDLRRCSYTDGMPGDEVAETRQTVRAVSMIYYLANPK